MTTIYRNYLIALVGDKYVGKSSDDDCLLVASSQQRLHDAIDDLWWSLDRGVEPEWFSGSSAIDVDTFGPESVPSSADPPEPPPQPQRLPRKVSYWTFGITALAVSAPLSYLMETLCLPKRVDVMLTIGVCAVAVAFGRRYALLAAAIAAVVFNFFACGPLMGFSLPTWSEFAYSVFNFGAALGIPELLKLRCLLGSPERGRTRRT